MGGLRYILANNRYSSGWQQLPVRLLCVGGRMLAARKNGSEEARTPSIGYDPEPLAGSNIRYSREYTVSGEQSKGMATLLMNLLRIRDLRCAFFDQTFKLPARPKGVLAVRLSLTIPSQTVGYRAPASHLIPVRWDGDNKSRLQLCVQSFRRQLGIGGRYLISTRGEESSIGFLMSLGKTRWRLLSACFCFCSKVKPGLAASSVPVRTVGTVPWFSLMVGRFRVS